MSYQLESASDKTSSMGRHLKKSMTNYKQDADRFARSVTDFVDVEDLKKSVHKAVKKGDYGERKNIVHRPIDWTKYPPLPRPYFDRQKSQDMSEITPYYYRQIGVTEDIESDDSESVQDENYNGFIEAAEYTEKKEKKQKKNSHFSTNSSSKEEYTRSRSDPGANPNVKQRTPKSYERRSSLPELTKIGKKISTIKRDLSAGKRFLKVVKKLSIT